MSEVRFSRTALLLGPSSREKLKNASVAIIGLGGVGSYAVEALVRAGIGHFTLIDFDVVGESNFNRQLLALNHTLGKPKTEVMKQHIEDINPEAEVKTYPVFLDSTNREELLPGQDFYLDAIAIVAASSKEEAVQLLAAKKDGWRPEDLLELEPQVYPADQAAVLFTDVRGSIDHL